MAVVRQTELVKPSEPWAQTAEQAAQRGEYDFNLGRAARSELALRNEMERLLRDRRPDARMCHEMVMGEGKVRADLVAVAPDWITAVEVKGRYDDTTRLLHQVGMYQLCVPEVWMVVSERQSEDAKLIRWLLPSVGLIVGRFNDLKEIVGTAVSVGIQDVPTEQVALSIEAEAVPRDPVPQMLLRLLWAAELENAARRHGYTGKRPTRAALVAFLLAELKPDALLRAACTELRGRDALWRADPPVAP